jgi:hypothetical protein
MELKHGNLPNRIKLLSMEMDFLRRSARCSRLEIMLVLTLLRLVQHFTITLASRNITLYRPTTLKKVFDFFLRKLGGFQWSEFAWGDLELTYPCANFSRVSIVSVDGKQRLSEVCLVLSSYTTSTHYRVKQSPKSTTGMSSVAYVMLRGARDRSCGQQQLVPPSRQCSSSFLALDSHFFGGNPDPCGSPGSLFSWHGSLQLLGVPKLKRILKGKSDESTKHYLTQILLAINWRYDKPEKFMHAYEDSRSPHASALN